MVKELANALHLENKFEKTSKIFCHFKLQKDVSTELGNLPYSQIFHWSFFYNLGSTQLSFRNYEQTKLQNPVNGNNG